MKTIHIFGWGRLYCNLAKRWRRGWERLRTMFTRGPDHPPLNVILRGPVAKSVQRAQNSGSECNHGFRPISLSPCIYLIRYSSFLTVNWPMSLSPHGGGRFTLGSSKTSPSSPGYRWCLQWHHRRRPMSGLYLPYQKILANENIHYDVVENLWPNPQDRVDIKKEMQWGILQVDILL